MNPRRLRLLTGIAAASVTITGLTGVGVAAAAPTSATTASDAVTVQAAEDGAPTLRNLAPLVVAGQYLEGMGISVATVHKDKRTGHGPTTTADGS